MKPPLESGEVLVAIMRDRLDFRLLQEKRWYRVPVESTARYLRRRWPPQWIAFYMTKVFWSEAFSIRHYGRIVDIREVRRSELFPNEPPNEKSGRWYYQLFIHRLDQLPMPIPSKRLRRFVFITTTWGKLATAEEINDLFDDSPLEDHLWDQFKECGIDAERQELVDLGERKYFLDFAIYCASSKLDVEADGDTWHSNPERAVEDNLRDNDLQAAGWKLLRFNSAQIREKAEDYCIRKVIDTVNGMGGVDRPGRFPQRLPQRLSDGSYQMDLFSASEVDFD